MKKLLISTALSFAVIPSLALAENNSAKPIPQQTDTIKIGTQQPDDPFQSDIQQHFRQLFDSFFNRAFTDPAADKAFMPIRQVGGVYQRTDMSETKDNIIISVDMPGANKDNINLEIVPGVVSIKYEQKEEKDSKDDAKKLSERRYAAFTRQFSLPDYAEVEKAEAEYKDGVLTITIPKNEKAIVKARKIEIK